MAATGTIPSKVLADIGAEPYDGTNIMRAYDNAAQTVNFALQLGDEGVKEKLVRLMLAVGDNPENLTKRRTQLSEHHSLVMLVARSPRDVGVGKDKLQQLYSVVSYLQPDNEDGRKGQAAIDALFGKLDIPKLTTQEEIAAAAAQLFEIKPKRGKAHA